MQIYKKLDVITNKHPFSEREGVRHHVMDYIDWDEEFHVHRFTKDATEAIKDITLRGKIPIIVGGTHYYLQNLLFKNKMIGQSYDLHDSLQQKNLTQKEIDILDGLAEQLFAYLDKVDPVIAKKFHPQDRRKLRRALEVYFTTGRKPSELYNEQKLLELEDSSLKYNTLFFWLYSDLEILRPKLEARVDNMLTNGALDEIKELYEFYKERKMNTDCTTGVSQVIGFKEFLPWLRYNDNNKLFDEGTERMKIRTRQYAKYQIKWIKKLLAVELHKESRFHYKNGGKIYLLDASNLSTWNENVKDLGINIARQFVELGPTSVTYQQAPDRLRDIFPSSSYISSINSNKILGSEKQWCHYECPICINSDGKNLVAVGEENWNIHLHSRRHKRREKLIERIERQRNMIHDIKESLPHNNNSL